MRGEQKKWTEVVLMPLVIAIVGILGTYLVTNEQREAADIRAATERQLKILDIFANRITSEKEEERLLAAQMLLAMDSDLTLKIMTTIDLGDEKSIAVKDAVSRIKSHAIRLKLAKNKKNKSRLAALLEGKWAIWRHHEGIHKPPVNWLEFNNTASGITVQGNGWKGNVTFDGEYGLYTWRFNESKYGLTEFYLDDTGILIGRVKQDTSNDSKIKGLNWTYWGMRADWENREEK